MFDNQTELKSLTKVHLYRLATNKGSQKDADINTTCAVGS